MASIRRPHWRICSLSRLTGREFYSFAGCYIQHPEIIRFFVYIRLDHGDALAVRRKGRRAIHVARSNLAERFALAVEECELPGVGLKDLVYDFSSFGGISWKLGLCWSWGQQ